MEGEGGLPQSNKSGRKLVGKTHLLNMWIVINS